MVVAAVLVVVMGCSVGVGVPMGTVARVVAWVHENIEYVSDMDGDDWSPPEVTLERGYGDCEDMALLVLWMVYKETGVKGDFVIGWVRYGWHGWVEVNGEGWDPQIGDRVPDWYEAEWYWSYDMAMLIAGRK